MVVCTLLSGAGGSFSIHSPGGGGGKHSEASRCLCERERHRCFAVQRRRRQQSLYIQCMSATWACVLISKLAHEGGIVPCRRRSRQTAACARQVKPSQVRPSVIYLSVIAVVVVVLYSSSSSSLLLLLHICLLCARCLWIYRSLSCPLLSCPVLSPLPRQTGSRKPKKANPDSTTHTHTHRHTHSHPLRRHFVPSFVPSFKQASKQASKAVNSYMPCQERSRCPPTQDDAHYYSCGLDAEDL